MTAFGQPVNTAGISVVGYSGPQPATDENHIYRLSVTAQLSGGSTGTLTEGIEFRFNTANALTGAPTPTTAAADNLSFVYDLTGSGELEDDANLTFDGTQLAIGVGLDVDGQTDLDELVVAGVSTFSNSVDINSTLDVDGDTQLDDLNVAGVATFSSLIDANNRLDAGGANIDQVNVTGITTLGAVDINGTIDIDGQLDVDELVVAGVSTFNAAVDIDSTLDVDGDTQLDDLNVAGVATFSSLVDANNRLDVVGGANLDQLNVAGVSTFGGVSTFNDDVRITAGGLDVVGVATFSTNVTVTGTLEAGLIDGGTY